MRKTIITILGLASLSGAQTLPGGTINGQTIPEGIFRSGNRNVCGDIQHAIRNVAREQAARDMNLTVTPEEIAAIRAAQKPDFVADSKFAIEQEKMMVAALTAVDKGQDPKQVYTEMLQPKGVDPAIWDSYQKQWKDPKGHALILQRLTWTPEILAKGYAAHDFEPEARYQKLDRLVDEELARADPMFRTALDHWNIPRPGGGHGLPGSEKQYLDAKREAYWKGREASLSVVLNDPALAQRCGLAVTK